MALGNYYSSVRKWENVVTVLRDFNDGEAVKLAKRMLQEIRRHKIRFLKGK